MRIDSHRTWKVILLTVSSLATITIPAGAYRCPDARLVVTRGMLTAPDDGPQIITLDHSGAAVAAVDGCTKVTSLRAASTGGGPGALMKAKLSGCAGRHSKLRLALSADAACGTFRGSFRSGPFWARLMRATPSVCGDGIVDVAGGEECESNDSCDTTCRPDCVCDEPTSTTHTTTTSTATLPTVPPSTAPSDDGDCLAASDEAALGYRSDRFDTNGDGIPDGHDDPDGDGLDTCAELYTYHTSPLDADSDDDGWNDGDEVRNGVNPNDPESFVLTPNEPVFAQIERPTDRDLFAFDVDTTRRVYFGVTDLSGTSTFTPCTRLLNAAHEQIFNDCGQTLAGTSTLGGVLTRGHYYLEIYDNYGDGGGAYRLDYVPLSPATAAELTPLEPQEADLPAGGPVHAYRFTLDAPRRIDLRALDLTGTTIFQPCVSLRNAVGESLATDCGEGLAEVDGELSAGTYLVVVYDNYQDAPGRYRLQFTPTLPSAATSLTPGASISRPLPLAALDLYSFTLSSTRAIALDVLDTTGTSTFNPCVRLYTPGGQFLGGDCGEGSAHIHGTLGAGTYLVRVYDNYADAEGTYTISLQ